jgi:hypothetical protein
MHDPAISAMSRQSGALYGLKLKPLPPSASHGLQGYMDTTEIEISCQVCCVTPGFLLCSLGAASRFLAWLLYVFDFSVSCQFRGLWLVGGEEEIGCIC